MMNSRSAWVRTFSPTRKRTRFKGAWSAAYVRVSPAALKSTSTRPLAAFTTVASPNSGSDSLIHRWPMMNTTLSRTVPLFGKQIRSWESFIGRGVADAVETFLSLVPMCRHAQVNAAAADHWRSVSFVAELILREDFEVLWCGFENICFGPYIGRVN